MCKECFLEHGRCCESCACCWKWRARAIWFPIFTIVFLILFILFYFPGYKNHNYFNENSVETNCTIINHIVRPSGKAYVETCDCKQTCNGGSCTETCGKCTHAYYEGVITVRYLETYTGDVIVIPWADKYKDANFIWRDLRADYAINSTTLCYYDKDDPKKFKLLKDPVIGWLITAFIFVGLIGVLWIIWSTLDTVRGCRKLHAYCRSEKTRKNHIKRQKDIEMPEMNEKDASVAENKSAEIVKSETVISDVSEVTVQ